MIVSGHAVTLILIVSLLVSSDSEPLPNIHVRRATDDNFNTLIDNLQKLARLTNGVSLEIGLLDGSIPSADVISELLHIGSAKDLIDFNSTGIDAAISEIQSLRGKWDGSPEVFALEDRLVFLESIRSSFDWAELKSSVRKDEYKKELGVVATGLRSKKHGISSIIGKIDEAKGSLQGLINKKWIKVTNPIEIQYATTQISNLSFLLGNVEDIAKNLNATLSEFEFAREIISKSTFLNVIDLERNLRMNLSISVPFNDESIKKLGQNLKTFNMVRENTVTAHPQIKIIRDLIQRRRRYEYTAGLPEGAKDLDMLKSDVEDDWIGKHIKDKRVVSEGLKFAFSFFDEMSTNLKSIESNWTFLSDQPRKLATKSVIHKLLEISDISDNVKLVATIAVLEHCDSTKILPMPNNTNGFDDIITKINNLNRDIVTFLDFQQRFNYSTDLKDLSALKNIFTQAMSSTKPKVDVVPDVVKQIIESDSFSSVMEKLIRLRDDLSRIGEHLDNIPALAEEITGTFSVINNYFTSLNYTSFLNCLDEVGENSADLTRVIELGRKKILEESNVEKLSLVMKNIIDSKILLGNTIRSAEKINKVKTREPLALKESLPNAEKISRNLGMAVQGLVAIKVAYEQNENLKPLFGRPMNIPGLQKTFYRIDNFLATLNETRRKRESENTDFKNFKSLGMILNHADRIPGFVKTIKDSSLNETSPEKQKALDILKGLDLNFAKFGFSEAIESLAAMDQFFLDYVRVMTAEPSTRVFLYNTQPPKESVLVVERNQKITPESISGKTLLICTIVTFLILSCLLLFVTVQIGCSKYQNAGKNKEKSRKEMVTEKSSQNDNLNTLIENLQKLARLSNGVSLEIALLDGSIPSADVISELLRIGSAKDLIDFNSTGIDAAISEIQSLSGKWDGSPEVVAIEERLAFLEFIRSSFDWAELKSSVRRDEYKKELGVVATGLRAKKQGITNIIGSIDFPKAFLQRFSSNGEWSNGVDATKVDLAFNIITSSANTQTLEEVENIAKNLDATLAEFEFALEIISKSTFLEILDEERHLRTSLSVPVPVTDESLKKLGQNLKTFDMAREKTLTAHPQIKAIRDLIRRRQRYEYTAGLPEGAKDLDKLKSDVEDDWIGKHIKDRQVVRENLKFVFSNFDGLSTNLKSIESNWTFLSDKPGKLATKSIIHKLLEISDMPDNLKLVTTMTTLLHCNSNETLPIPNSNGNEEIYSNISLLNRNVGALLGFRHKFEYTVDLKNLSELKNIFTRAMNATKPKPEVVADVVRQINQTLIFPSIMQFLERLRSDLTIIQNYLDSIPALADYINSTFGVIDNYYNSLNYSTFLACLGEVGDDRGDLKAVIELGRDGKILEDADVQMLNQTMKNIIDSKILLENAMGSAEKMKASEALSLKKSLPNSQEVSRRLGIAVQGLVAIRMAYEQKEEVKSVVKKIPELQKTFNGIDNFLATLNRSRRKFRRKRDPTDSDFKNLGGILDDADKVPGALIDLKAIKMDPTSKTYLEVLRALDILENLDLNFGKFEFKKATKSLEDMDQFFLDYVKAKTAGEPTTRIHNPQPYEPEVTVDPVFWRELQEWNSATVRDGRKVLFVFYWVLAAIAIFLVVGCAIFLIWINVKSCMNKRRQKWEESLAPKNLQLVNQERKMSPEEYWKQPNLLEEQETQKTDEQLTTLPVAVVADIKLKNERDSMMPRQWCDQFLSGIWRMGNSKSSLPKTFRCPPESHVKITGFLDASYDACTMTLGPNTDWIIAKAPSRMRRGQDVRQSSLAKFWAIIFQHNVQLVVQLGRFVESGHVACAKFYQGDPGKVSIYGRYKVRTLSIHASGAPPQEFEMFRTMIYFTLYEIKITDLEDKKAPPKFTQIICYKEWNHHGPPRFSNTTVDIVKYCGIGNKKVLVVSPDGVERAGAFVAIKLGIDMCFKQEVTSLAQVIQPVVDVLYDAIQTPKEVFFCIYSITTGIANEACIPDLPEYDALLYYYQQFYHEQYPIAYSEDSDKVRRCLNDKRAMEMFCAGMRENRRRRDKQLKWKPKKRVEEQEDSD
ncbi:hypothetical protein GCK72_011714 [Caenorhabditis remanei]|uniref:Tyrosine-protein phosphatase domain-containing protein n=1 Tax=Caenorhabditis remanei TaxID=31234 RepID=A0A6A5H6T1_CAERE|nr:hypothetical protein GCK72_011714 [Caenorhabditis remanei]KAF1763448.1 hypothetical protein GCK72_011714 [Caenorhabditis remanei]